MATDPTPPGATGFWRWLRRGLLHVGLLEWTIILYLLTLLARLLAAPDRQAALPFLWEVSFCLLLAIAATAVYRTKFDRRRWPRFVFYVVLLIAAVLPYSWLQEMIPIIHPGEVDAQLRAVDLLLVGGDASLWLERFATPITSAWFGSVYFGYYVVGSVLSFWVLLFCRREEVLLEFGLVILGTNLVAFILYTFFPALGPYQHLAHQFLGPLPEDTVVPFVHSVIQHGPLRDVFPSMHAGLPFAIFLFSARHYRWVALLTGLWLPHIVVSTMFLRYHYLIDVLAGLLLALSWFLAARPMIRRYQSLRRRFGVRCAP